MDLLFVADPLESFKIYKDTTFVMMREAQARGHTLSVCEPQLRHEPGRDSVCDGITRFCVAQRVAQRQRLRFGVSDCVAVYLPPQRDGLCLCFGV